jgi:hypothetical protein
LFNRNSIWCSFPEFWLFCWLKKSWTN